jgi:hypothetical protein
MIPKPEDKADKMKVGGSNGFLSVMLLLYWWGCRVLGGLAPEVSVWKKAVEETQKHITRMAGRPPKRKVSDVVLELEPPPAKKSSTVRASRRKK